MSTHKSVPPESAPLSQPPAGATSEPQLNAWIAALGRMSANHPAIARILHVIDRLQDHPFRAHVVIYGEPGTGKEGLARLIHRLMHAESEAAPLERVNLAGCTADEMLKLLFGADTYRSGDGSIHGVRSGALMRAQGGSLIVDELLALPLDVQRHLGERLSEQRLGRDSRASSEQQSNGVTLIGLTDGNLPRAVQQQLFRHDLAHRLMRIVLQVPPLRERPEDIAHSALWIANRVLRARGIKRPAELFESEANESLLSADAYRVSAPAIAALKRHHWPGNFRELEAVLERAILLYSDGEQLRPEDVTAALGDSWLLPLG